MEDKSYSSFLSDLCENRVSLKILETGICRGIKLLNWFCTDSAGKISSKPLKVGHRTKLLLNYFLKTRVPILEEYNPDKVICYIYHHKGVKIVTAKDAVELAENQLHGLQVKSIHMSLASCSNYYGVYRMHAFIENGELKNKLTYGKFSKDSNEEVKDPVIREKAISLTLYISDLIFKFYEKYLKNIKIDLIADTVGMFHIIKIKELSFTNNYVKIDTIIKGFSRNHTIKIDYEPIEEVSFEENASNHLPLKNFHDKDQKKNKDINFKLQIRKNQPQNSAIFLEMMAKTFDRDRKNQRILDQLKKKKYEIEDSREKKNSVNGYHTYHEELAEKKGLNSINDLLFYVEKTRPKVWLKDLSVNEDFGSVEFENFASDFEEKAIKRLDEASESKFKRLSPNMQDSLSIGEFRKRYKKNFQSFLSNEEKRLKIKLSPNSTKSRKNLGKSNSQKTDLLKLIGRKSVWQPNFMGK